MANKKNFILIEAVDMAEAVKIDSGCPTFNYDGVVEVREIMKRPIIILWIL